MTYDVFISHASEDKETVAIPLAERLQEKGYRVWIDSSELTVGDSLRERIDHGLASSRFGAVILSDSFFAKKWPMQELNALHARETQGKTVILPIWHKVDHSQILEVSPLLADVCAANTTNGIDAAADSLSKKIDRSPRIGITTPHLQLTFQTNRLNLR